MIFLTFLVVLASCLHVSVQRSTPADDSYVAAVLEYQHVSFTNVNLANYLRFIQEAAEQGADIMVFPELTLSASAIEVPVGGRLQQYPVPALQPDLYDEVLVAISEAARQHQIYVVINVEEIMNCTTDNGEYCPDNITYLFNTNVVFDRTGAVIDRYRKINLFGERSRSPALRHDLGVFETDFGVTFGHYICFDLQFQVPAFQVVESGNITDVIFTTMWFSELPYLTAVQIQEAYAYAQNVNFLASGANNVRVGSAGSGIFSGRAGALASTMPGLPTTRLLVARVPKVPGQVTTPTPGPTYDPPSDHDSLVLITDPSLPSHLTRRLAPGYQQFSLTDREVTCTFRVNITENELVYGVQHYQYRAAAFSGVRSYSGVATGGTRLCSVFACTGDTIDTCGKRFPQYNPKTTAIFEELSIVATVPTPVVDPFFRARDSGYFPVSLDTSIMPLEPEQYSYTEDEGDNVSVYTLTLKTREEELYSFAVWGRYFPTDGQVEDPPREQDVEVDDKEVEDKEDGVVVDGNEGQPGAAAANTLNGLLLVAVVMVVAGFLTVDDFV